MFVSSYSTYLHTNSTDKSQKEKLESQKELSSRFEIKDDQQQKNPLSQTVQLKRQLPVDYVSNYKVMNNQQKLQEETQKTQTEKTKFTKITTLNSAKSAYAENSTLFASLTKPKPTLEQTPMLDEKLPQEAKLAQEQLLKIKMLNTYIANDNYYKITA